MLHILPFIVTLIFGTTSVLGNNPNSDQGRTLGKEDTLTLTSAFIAPDGFRRIASVVNGQTPAPPILLKKGDSVKMNVVNHLSNKTLALGTSIHWHGMHQTHTAFMDGAAFVSQCPIGPGDSFEYSFDTEDRTGTYWYHSHYKTQFCDGIRGPLIIYDPHDPLKALYDVDDETTIITVTEWYHGILNNSPPPLLPDATLINGKGRSPGGPNVDLAIVNVQQGKRYRFRLVSMSCEPNFLFSIDNHTLNVIEADGTLTQPYTVNQIQIFVAQRYSFVLNADQAIGNYWIRAVPNFGNGNLTAGAANGVNSAILRYAGASNKEPTTSPQACTVPLNEGDLHPLIPSPPPPADVELFLDINTTASQTQFTINGTSFVSPTVPVLLQILSGARSVQDLLPAGSIFDLQRDKTVQVQLPSFAFAGPHVFHLHGHNFWVIRSAGTGVSNEKDPIIRDTLNIGTNADDFVLFRFRTDNPGPWFMHCHISLHLELGLGVVFAEAVEDIDAWQDKPTTAWDKLCPTWNALPSEITSAGSLVK